MLSLIDDTETCRRSRTVRAGARRDDISGCDVDDSRTVQRMNHDETETPKKTETDFFFDMGFIHS